MSSLGSSLRAARRAFAFSWVIASAAATVPFHRRNLATRARWLQKTCQRALRAIGVHCAPVDGPGTGDLIVANHVSYLDILVLGATCPSVFVAKREVRTWPVFGWFARCAGTRFIDRERRADVARVGAEFAPVIAEGLSVVMFLEGTSSDGREVKPFKSSLLAPAVERQWTVVPVALSYSVPDGHDVTTEVCWWGDMTLAPHLLHLLGLPRITAHVAWGPVETSHTDRKALAARLHHRVTRLHVALAASIG